jgi:hypothetical protein
MSKAFEKFDSFVGKIIPNIAVDASLRFIFSKTSILLHTIWFIYWFVSKSDVGLLTNIVSLEAIYVGILIGLQQTGHHESVKEHITEHIKKLTKGK